MGVQVGRSVLHSHSGVFGISKCIPGPRLQRWRRKNRSEWRYRDPERHLPQAHGSHILSPISSVEKCAANHKSTRRLQDYNIHLILRTFNEEFAFFADTVFVKLVDASELGLITKILRIQKEIPANFYMNYLHTYSLRRISLRTLALGFSRISAHVLCRRRRYPISLRDQTCPRPCCNFCLKGWGGG